jgi:GT2 family glycosyltransferase
VSVVVATFNRLPLLQRLLEQLAAQTLPPSDFEVLVVDDGSATPVAPALSALATPYALTVETQANAGAAAARDRGIRKARGELLVITDDDMQVGKGFLAQHLAAHPPGSRRAVMGRIQSDPALGQMPFFERWYAYRLDTLARTVADGTRTLKGNSVYTGNLSLRRADYLQVGGFDFSLKRSEDSELGLRLEQAGVEIAFSQEAITLHGSDHTSEAVWLKRAFLYGVYDSKIFAKHAQVPHADPWRYLLKLQAVARPLLAAAVVAPSLSQPLSRAGLLAVKAADKAGLQRLAFAGSSVVYTMEYFRGVREAAGSLPGALTGLAKHLLKRGG